MGYPAFEAKSVASAWLSRFGTALQEKDAESASHCIVQDGWLRESHIFTWDNRTLHGREKAKQHIALALEKKSFSNFQIDTRIHLTPERSHLGHIGEGVVSGFTFETDIHWGQGYAHLLQDNFDGVWRAVAVYMIASDIKGHEESSREIGTYGGHTIPWMKVFNDRKKAIEENPQVVIIGGSQTGVMTAACFKQMNIPTLIVEAHPRLGDAWRNRYDSLTLHTPRMHDSFKYQRYPMTWPFHTPKDKLADWIEFYAQSQDLTYWTNSKPVEDSYPIYDDVKKCWSITIDHAGERVTLNPAHMVLCMGTLGTPFMPRVQNRDAFKGTIVHGGEYMRPEPFAGKKVVVVGAGNTAGDLCLDLSTCADTITMVQRSPSTLIPIQAMRDSFARFWPDDESVPVPVSDFKFSSIPIHLLRRMAKALKLGGGGENGKYAEMYKGLREKGMVVDDGEDGEGVAFQILEKYAGFMIDVGFADLVISGRVGIKHGVEVASMKEESVVFSDGTEIPADVVIFGTGYHPIQETTMTKIFGEETMKRAGEMWGLDDEGESRGVYRPTGHPGLWFTAGGYQVVRYGAKQLAMLIKAQDIGLRG